MARDVVCGMEVDPQSAAAWAEYGGRCYYFCHPGCRAAFASEPERYLRAGALSEGLAYAADLAGRAGHVEASQHLRDWAERLHAPCGGPPGGAGQPPGRSRGDGARDGAVVGLRR